MARANCNDARIILYARQRFPTRNVNAKKKKRNIGEIGASCHTGLVVKKLITQSIYVRKFSFLYYRLLT